MFQKGDLRILGFFQQPLHRLYPPSFSLSVTLRLAWTGFLDLGTERVRTLQTLVTRPAGHCHGQLFLGLHILTQHDGIDDGE